MDLKKRNAQAHVEMILSFVIFVGFFIFLFIFLNPFQEKPTVRLLDITESAILEKLSINYNEVSLKVLSSESPDCWIIDDGFFQGLGSSVIVKNIDKEAISGSLGSTIIFDNDGDFYYLYFSDIFDGDSTGLSSCFLLTSSDYKIGTLKKEKAVYEGYFEGFKTSYDEGYAGLKTELGINNNFAFAIVNNDRDVLFSGERNIPEGINILARNIPVMMIDKSGVVKPIIINIQVW